MPDIVETLAQRGSAYGDFREQGRITQNLKRAMQDSPNWHRIPSYMREGLDMVQHKISRMLNGDPFYDDNLHDIIGYTKLMQDRAAQDREAGVTFEVGGDPLYPTFAIEDKEPTVYFTGPTECGIVNFEELTFEGRLGFLLSKLASLGFNPNDDGGITNEHGETPMEVLGQYANKMVVSDGSSAANPAFLKDPVRAYYADKRADAEEPTRYDAHRGRVAWAYTKSMEVYKRYKNQRPDDETLRSLVKRGEVDLCAARMSVAQALEEGLYFVGWFDIPKAKEA